MLAFQHSVRSVRLISSDVHGSQQQEIFLRKLSINTFSKVLLSKSNDACLTRVQLVHQWSLQTCKPYQDSQCYNAVQKTKYNLCICSCLCGASLEVIKWSSKDILQCWKDPIPLCGTLRKAAHTWRQHFDRGKHPSSAAHRQLVVPLWLLTLQVKIYHERLHIMNNVYAPMQNRSIFSNDFFISPDEIWLCHAGVKAFHTISIQTGNHSICASCLLVEEVSYILHLLILPFNDVYPIIKEKWKNLIRFESSQWTLAQAC